MYGNVGCSCVGCVGLGCRCGSVGVDGSVRLWGVVMQAVVM